MTLTLRNTLALQASSEEYEVLRVAWISHKTKKTPAPTVEGYPVTVWDPHNGYLMLEGINVPIEVVQFDERVCSCPSPSPIPRIPYCNKCQSIIKPVSLPDCDVCGEPQMELGALLFGAPKQVNGVWVATKRHICNKCYNPS